MKCPILKALVSESKRCAYTRAIEIFHKLRFLKVGVGRIAVRLCSVLFGFDQNHRRDPGRAVHALVSRHRPNTTRSAGDSPQGSYELRARHIHSGTAAGGVGETGGALGGIEIAPGTVTGHRSIF